MSWRTSADDDDFERYDYVIGAIFYFCIVAAVTTGAVVGYVFGYGLAVLAVSAPAAILLFVIGFAVPFWHFPTVAFTSLSFLMAADMVLGFPVAGTAPCGLVFC